MSYSQAVYRASFNGRAYAEKYLSTESKYQLKSFPEDFLHRMFNQDLLKGENLLDIGSGPTVRSVLSASAHIQEIYLSDLLECNREEIRKWLNKENDAFDCTGLLNLIAGFENVSPHVIAERVRNCVNGVFPCDVLQPNPLHPIVRQFDVVTTCECLDCLTDPLLYFQAVKNLASLIRKGGTLALISSLGCSHYQVGDVQLPAAKLDPLTARRGLQEAGLRVVVFEEKYYEAEFELESDNKGMFAALCRKVDY